MKKLLTLSLIVLTFAVSARSQTPDYSGMTSKNHPRLFITNDDLKSMRRQIANGTNPYLEALHNQMMKTADTKGMSPDSLSFNPVTAKVTLLNTMRSGLVRIVSDAYAYRYTKDKSYLKHVEMDINTVCDKMAYVFSALRLLILPLCVLGFCLLIGLTGLLPESVLPSAVMMACMPCGLNTIVFPKLVGEDCRIGARLALLTHLFSCLTIPIWLSVFH